MRNRPGSAKTINALAQRYGCVIRRLQRLSNGRGWGCLFLPPMYAFAASLAECDKAARWHVRHGRKKYNWAMWYHTHAPWQPLAFANAAAFENYACALAAEKAANDLVGTPEPISLVSTWHVVGNLAR